MNDEQLKLIAAYHDGELDPAGERLAKTLIDNHPDARAYWEALGKLNGNLHAAFDPVVRQPIPFAIHATLSEIRKKRHHHLWVPLAQAASVALVAVLLVRQGALDRQMHDQLLQMQQQIAQLRQQTLENVPSGTSAAWVAPAGKARVEVTPVMTYRTGDNQFCREYEERIEFAHGVEMRRGIACRTGKALWPDLTAVPSAGSGAAGENGLGVDM